MSRQLILPFALHESSTFERFVVGPNEELVDRLRRPGGGFDCIWLFGESGVGKTHLLQALCHAEPGASYIPAREIGADSVLDGYARFDVVTVDEVHRWLGSREQELALMGLYNRLSARRARLVLTANRSPLDVAFAVADLASRLRAAACYRVAPLHDEDKVRLLVNAGKDRGLTLAPDVVRFLLLRVSREQQELLRILDQLDRSSLAVHRRITIPFVKETLCL
ncbi:MAG: DnaA regulatory inactivator Hda [Gammaproteobacteria bacterium]|nr:DnaA regulatory inactivator Hda [Gammaproteobacteria bacterium]